MKRLTLAALALAASCSISAQSAWTKQRAPIMTTWGEELTVDDTWTEYPRPSMARSEWTNLNGLWQYFKRTSIKYDYEKSRSLFNKRILVPFPVESALSGIMDKSYSSNRNCTFMYRRTFSLPDSYAGRNVLLHFGAVDWRCYVYVNGQLAGTHDGGSAPFHFDITPYLKAEGEQELQVAVWDPTSGGQPNGKQSTSPSGIWYTASSGIWQTVWMEPVSPAHILSYEPIPDIDHSTASFKVNASEQASVAITIKDGDKVVTTVTGQTGEAITAGIPEAKLWSPDAPNLYTLDIALQQDGKEVDRVEGYFGMRKFSRGMVDRHPAVLLNNEPLYMYGPLDQGWWPDGLLTPPSYEAMIYDLQTMKDFGMNMVRKHIKLENDLWFDWCDKHGLVVWQDMVSGCGSGACGTFEQMKENFYRENDAIIDATRHHACIGAWVVYNEGWGQHAENGLGHTRMGVNRVIAANHDPGRFVHAVTGWTDVDMGDFIDVHSYPAPNASSNPMNERVASCGEFGGINLFVDGHMWAGSDVNYTTVEDADTYTNLYDHYTDRLQELQQSKGLWMSVYTQITDVEQECNGLMTYDRKVLKVSPAQQAGMKAKIEKTISHRLKGMKTVVPAGDENSSISWRYTTTKPDGEWFAEDYAATGWKTGYSGFGGSGRTAWSSSDIWIRRQFTISDIAPEQVYDLRLWMWHDEDAEIYINGKLAAKVTGYNNEYETWPILPEALQSLRLDGSKNTIAIHCHQTVGGQYIDCGIKLRQYVPNNSLKVSPMPAVTPKPSFTAKGGKAYLMSYTTTASNQLHYAYSTDGKMWTALNGNTNVMTGEYKDIQMLSPFIRRVEVDGKSIFHLVADQVDESKHGIYHWQSEDLINWVPTGDSPIVLSNTSDNTKQESPEFIFDDETGNFYIYWSARVNNKNTIYYATTKDWSKFVSARLYFDPGMSAYEVHIEKMGDMYYAFYYGSDKGLCVSKSKALKVATTSKFSAGERLYGSNTPKVRMPQSYPAFNGEGWHMITRSEKGLLGISGSGNPSENKWYPYNEYEFSLPEGALEGSVLTITTEELETLLQTFPYEQYDLLPTAMVEPQTWKYQTLTSASTSTTWIKPTYSDASWTPGLAGFGTGNPPSSNVQTKWTTKYIHLRKKLDLTGFNQEQIQSITGRIHHDEDVQVYFNGMLAFEETNYLTDYKSIGFTQEALDALTPDDKNVIAIECKNGGGAQYIDLGLTAIRPTKTDRLQSVTEQKTPPQGRGIYNLSGQALTSPQSGINIINGRKVAVK